MDKDSLLKLKQKLSELTEKEKNQRDLYLRKLSTGEIQGPPIGYASIDKPWLKYYSVEAILTKIPNNISMYEYMKKRNINNQNRIAINYYGNIFTYQEMFDRIDEIASKFLKCGVKSGNVVSICMPSTPETVFSIYALNKIGAICDMIDPRSNPEQMSFYLKENNSKLLLMCENYYKVLKDSIDKSDLDKVIIMPITTSAPLKLKLFVDLKTKLENINVRVNSNTMYWSDFMKIETNLIAESKVEDSDMAIIVHSSGTTSVPKSIILTNKNINSLALQYKLTPLKTNSGSRFLSVIPAFASFGVVASINLPLFLSMENYLLPLVSPQSFYKNIIKNKINFTLTIPANFKYMSRKNKKVDLSNLDGPGAGGYSLNSNEEKEINEYLRKNNCPSPMLMGWGMSELSSTACLEFLECSNTLSSGVPLPKNNISIFKIGTEEELKYGEEGEICVNGPTIMRGYLNNDDKTNEVIKVHKDGTVWLHSKDIGKIDEFGRIYPIDRSERIIIKGIDGFKIFPQKIEEVISSCQFVDTCIAVGYKDEIEGTIPIVYIILKEEFKGMENELSIKIKEICKEKLSIRSIPEKIIYIDKIPYTSMGKPDFKLLEKGYIGEENKENSKKKIRKHK